MRYRLFLGKSARKTLRRLDRDLQRRLGERFEQLRNDPLTPPLSDWLEGTPGLRKSRVGGWRILFRVDRERREVSVVAIRPRGQAYRSL